MIGTTLICNLITANNTAGRVQDAPGPGCD